VLTIREQRHGPVNINHQSPPGSCDDSHFADDNLAVPLMPPSIRIDTHFVRWIDFSGHSFAIRSVRYLTLAV
jgi:hypothetical protein